MTIWFLTDFLTPNGVKLHNSHGWNPW